MKAETQYIKSRIKELKKMPIAKVREILHDPKGLDCLVKIKLNQQHGNKF